MLKNSLLILLMITSLSFSAPIKKEIKTISILPALPVDISPQKDKSKWAVSFFDTYIRFRLEPLKEITVISHDTLYSILPNLVSYTNYNDNTYFETAQKLNCTYILKPQFEITKDKTVSFYIDIISVQNHTSIGSVEKDISSEQIPRSIDTLLLQCLSKVNCQLNPTSTRFYQISLCNPSYRSIKQFGELLYQKNTISKSQEGKLADEFNKFIEKDPAMLLAHYPCALLYMNIGQYEKASTYLKELLDLTPIHSSLFILLSQCYRMSDRSNEAFNTVSKFDQMGLTTVPYLYEKAKVFEKINQLSSAYKTYYQILSIDPRQTDALLFCARFNNNESKFSASLTCSEYLLKVDPDNAYGYTEQGRSYLGLGKIDNAVASLKKASNLLPNDPLISEYYADALSKANNYNEAISWYKKAITKNPGNLTLLVKTAKALKRTDNNTEALKLLKDNVNKFSDANLLKREIGILEYLNKNYQNAIAILGPYSKSDTNDIEVSMILGNVYEKIGQYDQALTLFLKVYPHTENDADCIMSIARLYYSKKDASSAQKYLKPLLTQRQVKGAYCLMGDISLLTNNIKDALNYYTKERELHGSDRTVQEKIASIQYKAGYFTQAALEYKRLLQVCPDHPDARYYIAITLIKDGNLAAAENLLKEAPAYGNGNAEVFYTLGNEFYSKNKFDKAALYLEKSLALNPKHEDALLKCAISNSKNGQDSSAAEKYTQLFTINNAKYSSYLAEAGHSFKKAKLYANAVASYLAFLSRGFTDINVNVQYAEIEYNNKNYTNVCSLLKNVNPNTGIDDQKVLLFLSDSRCRTGDYKGAIPLLNVVMKGDKINKTALKLAGLALEKTGEINKSIATYEFYLKQPRNGDYRDISFHLGELYESSKMVDKAIERYDLNRKIFPEDLRNYEHLGNLYMGKSMWKQAEDILEYSVALPETTPILKKMLAQTYYHENLLDKAIPMYTSYLNKSNNDAAAWKDLGKIYYTRKNYSESINAFSSAQQLQPNDFETNLDLGKALVESGNYKKAIVALGHAKQQKQNDLSVLDLFARCYRNLNETSSLTSILNEWITIDPKRYDIKLELGSIYLNEHEIDKAISFLNDAATFLPTEPRTHLFLAQAYEFKGNDSLRLFHLNKASKCGAENWELYYQYARYYLSKNKIPEAEGYLNKVLSQKSDHAESHFELALILNDKKNYEKALAELKLAIKYQADNPLYYSVIAYLYSVNDMRSNSLSVIDSALNLNPKEPIVYYWIAQANRLNNQKEAAFKNVNKALQINPDFAKGYEALGDLYMESFRFKEASRSYFTSWEKGGYNANRALKLGNALVYNQQFNEAKGFYEAIINHNDISGEALYRNIYTYCKLGDLKNAHKLQKLFQKDDAPWIQLAQGIVYESENNSEAAFTAYTIATRIASQNPIAYSGCGRIFEQKGKPDSALYYFRKALSDSLVIQNYIDIASVYQEKGMLDSALSYYNKVNARYPEHPYVQIYIASIKSQLDDHQAAVAVLKSGLIYHPQDPTIHFMLGQELESLGTFQDAIGEYQTSLKLGNGQPVDALKNIGTIYFQKLVNDKKAKEFYKKYVKAGGNKNDVADAMKKLEGI